ncbi:NAD(P)/FAD-dependent oxidoreductase [Granulicella sibirica]|uniref:D-amino-acid oxidase n=1 Tax=Granulicella sibirica TaxID=2479048 RepID=A0A4V1L533_9BACT|nr:FAD-dependent oxidoreductase [Granulicella sibirica]RXH54364.1 D-amino-acid oxidase [Granulicella sibirica]
MTTFDTIVVGGGIVGAACAAAFARDGLTVALIESGSIGHGATAAAMGHVVLMDDSAPQLLLTRFSQSLWQSLVPNLSATAEYQPAGTIWIASDAEELHEAARKQSIFAEYEIAAQLLDPRQLATLEPNLASNLAGALLVPSDSIVNPLAIARTLVEQAVAHGAQILTAEVLRIGAGTVDLSDGRRLFSRRIVNAAGERSTRLTPGLPIRLRKGHLALTEPHPNFLHHQIVELGYLKSAHCDDDDSVAFNVQPRATGQILIGSSRQYGSTGPEVEPVIIARILARAAEYMPTLAGIPIATTWTGFRSATPDKLPLIGPWPEDETIFLATGHEGLGITTSPATAALLADHFAGRESAIPLTPYLPARLATLVAEPQAMYKENS